ncbi:hypothetical protein CR513_57994, partial [Mucuna pruriens]
MESSTYFIISEILIMVDHKQNVCLHVVVQLFHVNPIARSKLRMCLFEICNIMYARNLWFIFWKDVLNDHT